MRTRMANGFLIHPHHHQIRTLVATEENAAHASIKNTFLECVSGYLELLLPSHFLVSLVLVIILSDIELHHHHRTALELVFPTSREKSKNKFKLLFEMQLIPLFDWHS